MYKHDGAIKSILRIVLKKKYFGLFHQLFSEFKQVYCLYFNVLFYK